MHSWCNALQTDGVGAKSGEQCMALKDTMMVTVTTLTMAMLTPTKAAARVPLFDETVPSPLGQCNDMLDNVSKGTLSLFLLWQVDLSILSIFFHAGYCIHGLCCTG